MGIIPNFWSKKKKPVQSVPRENNIRELVHEELKNYVNKENLQKYLELIQRDRDKLRIWNGMSTRQKIKLLRHVAETRGMNAKK